MSRRKLTSQPSMGSLLQSPQPSWQTPATQWPPWQLATACADRQAVPQLPQLRLSLEASVHWPSQQRITPGAPQRASSLQPGTQIAACSDSVLHTRPTGQSVSAAQATQWPLALHTG